MGPIGRGTVVQSLPETFNARPLAGTEISQLACFKLTLNCAGAIAIDTKVVAHQASS